MLSRGFHGSRSLRPLRAMTTGCFKSKAFSSPRTSTPLNSTANRGSSGPRPQFVTPYRKQEANRVVTPLARCSSPVLQVSGSSEVQGADGIEPSSKKPRKATPYSTSSVKVGHREAASKVSLVHSCDFGLRSFYRNRTHTEIFFKLCLSVVCVIGI